jgi:Tfp pilus assembly protein PilP
MILTGLLIAQKAMCDSSAYSPIGKRDPFLKLRGQSRDISSIENSLFNFQIEQFELKAIRRGPDGNHILVADPEGKNYLLQEGEKMGKTQAVISRILDREVILSEQTKNYLGKEILNERILSLPGNDELKERLEP